MQKITFRKLAGEKYIYPELQGHFIEFLGSCIYDGIWVGEDSEIPNYHGIRKDLVDAFQKLHPPVIRWPGGCFADVYHWRNGIGPREQRPVTYNENFGTFETDPNQFGTHEMMEFCEMIGAKPWFNINMMTGSPCESGWSTVTAKSRRHFRRNEKQTAMKNRSRLNTGVSEMKYGTAVEK